MLFASTLFLFAFLPAVIVCYYLQKQVLHNRLRNSVLLVFSYLFYAYGTAEFVLVLLLSSASDYALGLLIDRRRRYAKLWLALSLIINLGLLAYFKYANFFIAELSRALASLGQEGLRWPAVVMPIGISFFTFQKLSYVIDIYRRHVRALANFLDFALYVAMFPQLVAGPIVRFKDIWDQLTLRQESWEAFNRGVVRFCWGLGKKVLIADACGQIADAVFGLAWTALDTKTAWLGAAAYTLQIYFDFSAYSDMAIGLGRMFGFELGENFNRPYSAVSITDFWRRWHISLSRWFKDYLYIPLGGNRKGSARTYGNLLAVFTLCGLWHGANWTFVVWGLYHGIFLALERVSGMRRLPDNCWYVCRRALTLVVVICGWVLFRSPSLTAAVQFLRPMFVLRTLPLQYELYRVLHFRNLAFVLLAICAVLAAPRLPTCEALISRHGHVRTAFGLAIIGLLLPYCAAFVISGTGHPFIYFRF